jgi:aspartyl-tRNA(Asn)/glutamyl-tRNA(Gln) amidotransferase subunit C
MSERIPVEQVRHVANLARLDVTDEEVELFSEQLSVIATHFDDIQNLDIADVPPSTHAVPVINVFREDVVRPSLDRDKVLASAPQAEDGRFRVPSILGEEG